MISLFTLALIYNILPTEVGEGPSVFEFQHKQKYIHYLIIKIVPTDTTRIAIYSIRK